MVLHLLTIYTDSQLQQTDSSHSDFGSLNLKREMDIPFQLQQPRQSQLAQQGLSQSSSRILDTRVHVYDMRAQLSISYSMASKLRVTGPAAEACEHNRTVCEREGKKNLSQVWKLVGHIVGLSAHTDRGPSPPWMLHPLAQRTIQAM